MHNKEYVILIHELHGVWAGWRAFIVIGVFRIQLCQLPHEVIFLLDYHLFVRGGGGGMMLPGCNGEYSQVDLPRHGRELFLCHCGGDGWTTQGRSDSNGGLT
jgi:hypothetical protein